MIRAREHAYETRVVWSGASQGPTTSYAAYSRAHTIEADGKPSLAGSADPVFRGDASLWNPEEMLVAALSTCHLLSYLALCALEGIAVTAYRDRATGIMSEMSGAGKFVSVVLRPEVEIDDERVERATALHEKAHAQCFIANSVNFPVEHQAVVARRVESAS
ncbi:MAG: OsmC family protein [Candidatus Eremiobacteraeota bacterium]|nr:OsmC family protein [Candidatus Eremiobacteraeota bacterium]